MIAKSKIVEASIKIRISDVEKLLIKILLSNIKNINNQANNAINDKITAFRGFKKELCI